jgi:putative hydrolase of the HAD superfamily
MAPVRAVIFDFGGVLCLHPDEARWSRVAEIADLPLSQFMSAFWAHRINYDAGKLEPADYWRGVLGPSFQESKLPELVRGEIALWNQYDQRIFDWIAQLRSAGFRTAILSNLPRVLGEELRRTPGFLEHFDHVTFSYELGVVKPQSEIYVDAIRGLEVEPSQALFLDDKAENVEGARAIGLQAVLYTTWENFSDLENFSPAGYGLPVPAEARRQ